jgi:hypothetical protein
LGDCLGHFCGHWAIFSQKHLVTLTFDERLTLVERVLTMRPGYRKGLKRNKPIAGSGLFE